jgi:hypothetical protein
MTTLPPSSKPSDTPPQNQPALPGGAVPLPPGLPPEALPPEPSSPTRQGDLSGFSPAEAEHLRAAGYHSLDDIWAVMTADPADVEKIYRKTHERVQPKRIISVLADQVLAEAKRREAASVRLYWPEVIMVIFVALLVLLAIRAWIGW